MPFACFARLTANLAIAVAHGRYGDRVGQLERLMALCAREQPIAQRRNGSTRTGHGGVGAEFAIKELVFALGELERAGTFPKAKTDAAKRLVKWRNVRRGHHLRMCRTDLRNSTWSHGGGSPGQL